MFVFVYVSDEKFHELGALVAVQAKKTFDTCDSSARCTASLSPPPSEKALQSQYVCKTAFISCFHYLTLFWRRGFYTSLQGNFSLFDTNILALLCLRFLLEIFENMTELLSNSLVNRYDWGRGWCACTPDVAFITVPPNQSQVTDDLVVLKVKVWDFIKTN